MMGTKTIYNRMILKRFMNIVIKCLMINVRKTLQMNIIMSE